MVEIQPNIWYSLEEIFGDSLGILDEHIVKQEPSQVTNSGDRIENANKGVKQGGVLDRISKAMKQQEGLSYSSFEGGNFEIGLEFEKYLIGDISKTCDGDIIYFPCGQPTKSDIRGFVISPDGDLTKARTFQYAQTFFTISPVKEEDLVSGFYEHRNPSDTGKIDDLVRDYKYILHLRTEAGEFVSEDPVGFFDSVFEGEGKIPYANFKNWRPVGRKEGGVLYLPLESKRVASLELKLAEKGYKR
ncbi:MAG TPA: hypothetical protein HA282_00010 [Nanoarchaeota archaeon]|nr:hypothetical protein [Candidatus Pacearchaeota archaeon]HIH17297.1 hypothetical protein [Nanoarchaeota archaeon]HIH34439.1 hypothetical protein [Nanoarchaeota archaeon]HIH51612.1 hypothetical protein [Nanoarchaeota archaeon]HIH65584.1 hypothetical protein [Nanoarchaeota archaeon]